MSNDLTDDDARKLFNEISNATRENDGGVKLSELMKTEATEEVAPIVDTPAEEPVIEDDKEDEVVEDTSAAPPSPPTEEDTKEDDKPAEPTELDKLREQLEKLSKENHALRSQAGRVPFVQRKIKEIDKRLEELTKASTPSQTSTKIQPKVLDLLKGIKDTDPDLADTIAAVIETATKGVAEDLHTKEVANLNALRAAEVQTYQDLEAERLLDMYPNAVEVFKSPTWVEWKNSQSSQMAAFANSDNADDVAFAFNKYAQDMVAKYPQLAQPEDSKAVAAAAPAPNAEAERIEAERKRKQKTAVTIGSPAAPAKVSMPDDPQALFNKFSEEIRKQRTGG